MRQRQYLIELAAWLVAYALLLYVSSALIDRGASGLWLVIASLIPMLPAIGIVGANMRRYRAMDELERRVLAEAIVFAFGCTAIITFSYGFLENSAHAPVLSYFWVWPIMAMCWIAGNAIAARRYK